MDRLSPAGDNLAPAHALFAEILRIADDAIICVGDAQRITLFNTGAERIFGYTATEVMGQPLTMLMPESLRAHHEAHVRAFGESGDSARMMARRGEIFGRRKDGQAFPAEASISTLSIEGGRVFTVFLRDISARKDAEAALRRAHDQLEARVAERTAELVDKNRDLEREIQERQRAEERLARQAQELARSNADLEQFAYVASHDLQEPLRMVASYTQLIAKRYRGRLDEDADEFIAFVVDGALRMQRLINDLLAFSRVGTRGKAFTLTSWEAVMQRVASNLATAIEERHAEVTWEGLPTLPADDTQAVLLLQNLVGNAIKFNGAEPPRVRVAAHQVGSEWQFSVSDNGIGIDPQYAERIFVIFQRLHPASEYPGTGIGLAICKKVVERHGGRIWLDSTPGGGTTFYFTLPERQETGHEQSTRSDPDTAG